MSANLHSSLDSIAMSRIHLALTNLFQKHRIVFWYDSKRELRDEFESLLLPGVETVEINNNEFAVKHRILREEPAQKFLLYHAGPQPEDLDNWLLDVQLASGLFLADQASLWLSELELPARFLDLAQIHAEFFSAEIRRRALKALIPQPLEEAETSLRLKILAVCAGVGPRMDEITESLLAELAEDRQTRIELIRRCGLETFLWERMQRNFGYHSSAPSSQDFALELFKSCYALELGLPAQLTTDALVFLRRWKDSRSHHQAFESLSAWAAESLSIEADLQNRDIRALGEIDIFRLVDQKILSDLVASIASRTINPAECAAIIRQRRRSHWYAEFQHYYSMADFAAQFMKLLDESVFEMNSLEDGIQRYIRTWQRLDHFYRKTVHHYRQSGHASLLSALMQVVENHYNTNYLLKLSNAWQPLIDSSAQWGAPDFTPQREFFTRYVEPFLSKDKKIYVIISDALRYEIAEELLSLVRQEDRYDAELSALLGMLPSYTQLGMASLLPNQVLSLAENSSGEALVDGANTVGTPNREKVLRKAAPQSCAIRAEELLTKTRDELRALVRDNDVVYIYHNRIDLVGDKRDSEERVFDAVEDALTDLLNLVKKLTAANATNLLVTADHGFIYQNRAIEESDFSSADMSSPNILYLDRRFVLGKNLPEKPELKKFHASQVGLDGDIEIQFPKSIQRLRLKGSGSRYVHGGTSLQEIVVPVLQINKKRESDISRVDVEILRGSSSLITAGQLSVTLYQAQAVSDKVRGRKMRAGIYSQSGQLISDQHELDFDLTLENPRERELPVRFILVREADQFNNQEVILKLEEKVADTSHYQEYKSTRYTLRRSFTSDFDF
jgi:uncharacterized protein (TIGR02687 family)